MSSFEHAFHFGEQVKVAGGLNPVNRLGVLPLEGAYRLNLLHGEGVMRLRVALMQNG
jgi:hypothetical protein